MCGVSFCWVHCCKRISMLRKRSRTEFDCIVFHDQYGMSNQLPLQKYIYLTRPCDAMCQSVTLVYLPNALLHKALLKLRDKINKRHRTLHMGRDISSRGLSDGFTSMKNGFTSVAKFKHAPSTHLLPMDPAAHHLQCVRCKQFITDVKTPC